MRYAQGGGLTDERRAFREQVRRSAAEGFARGEDNAAIARRLRVHVRSVQRWRRSWLLGGSQALASKGVGTAPLLSEEEFAELEQELHKGATAHGWPDPQWTLDRIRILIERRFGPAYTIQGVAALLKRHGWSRRPLRRRPGAGPSAGWAKG
ncbi:winged helix-turn-helix domain-containing protein [Kitasatospora kifunensis]|uniref:Transposase n=1 Tax=Kitasatospora kifunensis TaxID=58351 RepID=A0A7W7VY11_KITKI|nr:winged helix-turn-helix domain-containing protein [Kitasatospora kifunensis]MBB4926189.1 transposase [Kitasatospora kifunensis]